MANTLGHATESENSESSSQSRIPGPSFRHYDAVLWIGSSREKPEAVRLLTLSSSNQQFAFGGRGETVLDRR